MNKASVDSLVKALEKNQQVKHKLPWRMEAIGDSEFHIRFVGLQLTQDWQDICSLQNNFLLKFIVNRQLGKVEYYLANQPPFVYLWQQPITSLTKWKDLLGPLKQKIHQDLLDYQQNQTKINNLYQKMKSQLKK